MNKKASFAAALLLVGGLGSLGCAATPRPILSDTKLGSVIIYRNGVAYFERYAPAGEKELVLRVPTERVDDFLKSLSIVDEKSGKTMPISYPTIQSYGGYVEMTIKLPLSHARLRITYVTESPAWKPSYRVVLDDSGKARLLGWAVVDNVSGEDWKNVHIGVGSTSALSFRYDLHSVRLVERETLSTGARLAAAPPTGGSPYAVASRKVRVVGNITKDDLANLQGKPRLRLSAAAEAVDEESDDVGVDKPAEKRRRYRTATKGRRARGKGYLRSLSQRIQAGAHNVRIEGFAQAGDRNPQQQSLARANEIRNKLVAMGVPKHRVHAVGTGVFNAREVVRVLETDEEAKKIGGKATGAEEPAVTETQPIGHAHFVSATAMSIEKDHSAMVSIINAEAVAERVYYYDPVSARGSKKYAFNAVRLVNPSKYTLDRGPFTVYANKGQFLGEGLADPILPHSTAFVPYALDRSIIADPEIKTREEIDRLLTIQRGIVTTETRRIRRTQLTLTNRGKQDAKVYVRHKVGRGYKLSKRHNKNGKKVEKLGGAHLFPVDVKAGQAVELIIEEFTPLMKTVDIRTQHGIRSLALFLKKSKIEPQLKEQLDAIVK